MKNQSKPEERTRPASPEQAREQPAAVAPEETTPAEERGERLDTGKAIARGGQAQGEVPGATPQEKASGG